MNEWHDLLVSTTGASAALTGLIFVGVSINLTRILSLPTIPERALLALLFLLAILVLSVIMLIPQQSTNLLGIEITAFAVVLWITTVKIEVNVYRKAAKDQFRKYYIRNAILNQLILIPYIAGGINLACANPNGIYWLVFSFIFSFIKVIVDSWVLLVEINR